MASSKRTFGYWFPARHVQGGTAGEAGAGRSRSVHPRTAQRAHARRRCFCDTPGNAAGQFRDSQEGIGALGNRRIRETGDDGQCPEQQLQAQSGRPEQGVGQGFTSWNAGRLGHGGLHLPMGRAVRPEQAACKRLVRCARRGKRGRRVRYALGQRLKNWPPQRGSAKPVDARRAVRMTAESRDQCRTRGIPRGSNHIRITKRIHFVKNKMEKNWSLFCGPRRQHIADNSPTRRMTRPPISATVESISRSPPARSL